MYLQYISVWSDKRSTYQLFSGSHRIWVTFPPSFLAHLHENSFYVFSSKRTFCLFFRIYAFFEKLLNTV